MLKSYRNVISSISESSEWHRPHDTIEARNAVALIIVIRLAAENNSHTFCQAFHRPSYKLG